MRLQSKQLWLLRHAKAEVHQTTDYDRPLAEKGIRQISRISKAMPGLQLPDHIISSPALRAKQTTQLLCEQLNISFDTVQWDQRIYEASTSQLITILEQATPEHCVLFVGHNPGFEGLFEYLTGGLTRSPAGFIHYTIPTATLVQIDMPDNWKTLNPGCAQLNTMIYPNKKR